MYQVLQYRIKRIACMKKAGFSPNRIDSICIHFAILGVFLMGLSGLVAHALRIDLIYPSLHWPRMTLQTAAALALTASGLWILWYSTTRADRRYHFPEDEKIAFIGAAYLAATALTVGLAGFAAEVATLEGVIGDKLWPILENRNTVFQANIKYHLESAQHAGNQNTVTRLLRALSAHPADLPDLQASEDMQSFLQSGFSGIAINDTQGRQLFRIGRFVENPAIKIDLGKDAPAVLLWDNGYYLNSRIKLFDHGIWIGTFDSEQPLTELTDAFFTIGYLGQTGEIGMCFAQDAKRLSCFPQLHRPFPFQADLPDINSRPTAMALAVSGKEGMFDGPDYRGKNIVATYKPIATGLGLVVKQDTEELLAPIRAQMAWGLPLLFLLVGVGAIILRAQIKPIGAHMHYQASHDDLTGLINRHEFERRLNVSLKRAKREHKENALLYLDLDRFKIVNDTCGHLAGDELLRQLSGLLSASIRQSDTLARLGGDEFCVLLEHCETEKAMRIAEKLLHVVGGFRFVWQDKAFPIGISIGLICFGEKNLSASEVFQMADAACYAAKDKGRNRIQVYTQDDRLLAQRRGELGWLERIRAALDEDRFVLYAQKIIPLKQSAVGAESEGAHFELLIRMVEEGELIPPMAFIPTAERYGIMPALDRWVIRAAFADYTERVKNNKSPCTYAINLSGASIGDEDFLNFVLAQFKSSDVPPHKICFEITETSAIANLNHAAALIGKLKAIGCRFSLDDFGSGMSSFAYLKHLPVDYLKIDGGFVKNMVDDPIDHAMVESVNHIGHVMGIKTIAEFVGNDAILNALGKIGVDYAQGYWVAEPIPLHSIVI